MRNLNDRLADSLKRLRNRKGWSLQELADRSRVSRATLSRIENAEVSPTAETLGSLSAAYSMTISQLLLPVEASFAPLVRRDEQSVWKDAEHGFVRRNVSPPGGALSAEVLHCELAPRQAISYDAPPVAGVEHHLVMLGGALTIMIEDNVYDLRPGDCLRYRLFSASRFETAGQAATYLLVLA